MTELEVTDEFPDVMLINLVDVDRIKTGIEELEKSLKKAGVPFNGFWTLVFGLAGQLESFNKVV